MGPGARVPGLQESEGVALAGSVTSCALGGEMVGWGRGPRAKVTRGPRVQGLLCPGGLSLLVLAAVPGLGRLVFSVMQLIPVPLGGSHRVQPRRVERRAARAAPPPGRSLHPDFWRLWKGDGPRWHVSLVGRMCGHTVHSLCFPGVSRAAAAV